MKDAVRLEVCAFLAEELERDPSSVAPDSRIVEDLEADSVVLLALFEELQRRHRVRANLRQMAKSIRGRTIVTVDDLCDVIVDFLEGRIGVETGQAP